MKLSKTHGCSHGEIRGKEERQIEDKTDRGNSRRKLQKNPASVLKPLPDCGSMNNGDVQNVTIIHTSTRQRTVAQRQHSRSCESCCSNYLEGDSE
jgi:hypothetical protein